MNLHTVNESVVCVRRKARGWNAVGNPTSRRGREKRGTRNFAPRSKFDARAAYEKQLWDCHVRVLKVAENHHSWLRAANLRGMSRRSPNLLLITKDLGGQLRVLFGTAVAFLFGR